MDHPTTLQGEWLLAGARLLDPGADLDRVADLRLEDGRIAEIGEGLQAARRVDLKGRILCPGFVDLRATFGEPGHEERESIASGLRAAASGGYTAVCVFADSDPVVDNEGALRFQLERAQGALTRLLPVARVTRGGSGERLADLGELAEAGAAAFSDGPGGLPSAAALRGSMVYAHRFQRPLFELPCERSLLGGEVNEGSASLRSGLKGIPALSEELGVQRALATVAWENRPLHLQLLSTERSMELMRKARQEDLLLSADVGVHHLAFSEEDFLASDYNPAFKADPPLRPHTDREALRQAVREGLVEAIVSDHRPADFDRIDREFSYCPAGAASLETCFAAAHLCLVETGLLSLADLLPFFSDGPRRVLGLPAARLQLGEMLEATVLAEEIWTYREREAFTRGRNSPWEGREFRMRPVGVLREGRASGRDFV